MPINNFEEAKKAIQDLMNFLDQQSAQNVKTIQEPQNDFDELKSLLGKWPVAVEEFLICKETEDDKAERAEGIIDIAFYALSDYLKGNIKDKKFLDFGCGEGHVVKSLVKKEAKAFGYDILQQGSFKWEEEKEMLTTDWEKIKANAPYDAVIVYDVLDHCHDPVGALKQIKEITETAPIFCRCHPWPSPHGGHLYKKINKAYAHLIFTEEELHELGVEVDFSQKTFMPMNDNAKWFNDSGVKSVKHDVQRIVVNDFFKNENVVSRRLSSQYNGTFPEWQMGQEFNDYVLI
jgi:2-polyprenyl-3-methyl-5-hydroxy-6-metoxy-1,4-benzoquinol methylase